MTIISMSDFEDDFDDDAPPEFCEECGVEIMDDDELEEGLCWDCMYDR